MGVRKMILRFVFGFILVLVLMISFLRAMPMNFFLGNVQSHMTLPMALSEIEGTLWQGSAVVRPGQMETLSKDIQLGLQTLPPLLVAWHNQLNWPLKTALDTRSDWFKSTSQLDVTQEGVQGFQIQAEAIDLVTLSQAVPLQNLPFKPESGTLMISDLSSRIADQWLDKLEGKGAISALKMMGVSMPMIYWQLNQEEGSRTIEIRLDSEQKGQWRLTGQGAVTESRRFQFEFSLKLTKADAIPDWAYVMQRKSALEYVAKFQGKL
jgi:hypothetical protein